MARKKKAKYEFQAEREDSMGDDNVGELLISFVDEEGFESSLDDEAFAELDDHYVDDYEDDDGVEDISSIKGLEIMKDRESGGGNGGGGYDLIRFYLNEIASHSLLTKEEEMEMAREIERGQRVVAKAMLSSSLMLREVINLGDKLNRGAISVRDVANTFGDESEEAEEETLLRVKRSISAIKKIYYTLVTNNL